MLIDLECMSNKIAVITDLHLDIHRGDERYWKYFSKFYNELFFPYLEENNIEDLLILGDVIDERTFINFRVLKRIREEFFEILNKYRVNVILGNHDVYYRTSNEVNSLESLLNEYKNITVHKEPIELFLNGVKFFLLPWINDNNKEEFLDKMKKSKAEILCAHLEIRRGRMNIIRGKNLLCEEGIEADEFSQFEQVWSGHFHHRSQTNNIQYIGNPYELKWDDCKDEDGFSILNPTTKDERGFSVFDPNTKKLEFIKNPFSIFACIDYDDTINNYHSFDYSKYNEKFVKVFVHKKNNDNMYKLFIKNLYDNGAYDVKIIDNIEIDNKKISIKDINEVKLKNTLDIFNNYIEELEIEVDIVELKNEIEDLYKKASEKND